MKPKKHWIALINLIFLCFIIALIGSIWTQESIATWYSTLIKPSWTPPDALFAPVWSFLYIMIAIAGWLIYRAYPSHQRTVALIFYGAQLALNFIWPFLFFSLQSPSLGLVDILLLLLCIGMTIIKAWHVRLLASLLLLPYLFWVIYAASLNAGIWLLNR